jgi:hypothetical protein
MDDDLKLYKAVIKDGNIHIDARLDELSKFYSSRNLAYFKLNNSSIQLNDHEKRKLDLQMGYLNSIINFKESDIKRILAEINDCEKRIKDYILSL